MANLNEILALTRNYNKIDASSYIVWQKSGADRFVLADDGELQLANATASGQGFLLGGDVELYRSAANVGRTPDSLLVDSNLVVGALGAVGDSPLHVWNATAGTVAAAANTILTIENSTHAYLSFLTPNTSQSGIMFGDPQSNAVGTIIYSHSLNTLFFDIATVRQLNWTDGAFAFQKSTTISAAVGTLTINAFTAGGDISIGTNRLIGGAGLLKIQATYGLSSRLANDSDWNVITGSSIFLMSNLAWQASPGGIQPSDGDGSSVIIRARDTGVGLVEIARMMGAADPYFQLGPAAGYLRVYASGSKEIEMIGKVTDYEAIATEGSGLPAVRKKPAILTGQTAVVASVGAITTPNDAADHEYLVTGFLNVTAYTSGTINLQATYTDHAGVAQTKNITLAGDAGTTTGGATSGGYWQGLAIYISADPNTAITVLTAGTFTATYDVGGVITQVN